MSQPMVSTAAVLSEQEHEHFEKANDWEASRTWQAERSERRAWRVAGVFGAGMFLALAGVAVMATKYTVEPMLLRENTETGAFDVITRLRDVDVTGDEVRDKHWIGRFVEARESYDWYTLEADYNTVGLLSGPDVGAAYGTLFAGEDALQERWGRGVRATVDVLSIVLNGNSSATVRFAKRTVSAQRGAEPETTYWIATLGYQYDTSLRISESLRRINPWGFQVMSYRVDPELQGAGS